MEEKVKAWCEMEYKECVRKTGYDINAAVHRCYGIVMFAINTLFDDYNQDLADWWDTEMLQKFRDLK